jgi:hypothetical protein
MAFEVPGLIGLAVPLKLVEAGLPVFPLELALLFFISIKLLSEGSLLTY